MADLFEEVEEQLRSDRYKTFALKAAPWVLGALLAALAVALGIWGWQSYTTRQITKASEQYAQAQDAFAAGRTDEAFALWGEVAESSSKGYRSLALMQQGGVRLAAGKTDVAVKLFDEAAEAAPNAMIGDAARLKSALALLDTAPYKEMETRLNPLIEDGRPYRVEAREARAFAKLMAGDVAGAKDDFTVIQNMIDSSDGARQRAGAALDLIESGGAKAVPAAVKAAAALPSSPTAAEPAPQSQAPGSQ